MIKNEGLRKLKKPYFRCPVCKKWLKIQPSMAKCAHCNNEMKYYKYDFTKDNRIAKCTECNGYNKLPYVTD